jgi:4-amino-4-deoxy-L-arabinose transferase-like glycosyltransferase
MRIHQGPLAVLSVLALAGSAAVLVSTSPFGIGISAESETYVSAARNFAEGQGLVAPTRSGTVAPLTQHAPLYAMVLGLCGRFGADVVDAARWVSAISLGVLILLAGFTAGALSNRPWAPPIAGGMVLFSLVILGVYLTALSESLFLVATVALLLLLVRYLQDGGERFLVAASLACAAALLTRFAGLAAVATGVVTILLYDRPARRRIAAVLFAALSCAPAMLWGIYAAMRAGNPVHREFAVHPAGVRDAAAALRTLSTWILPGMIPAPIRLAVLAVVLLWLANLLRSVRIPATCRVLLWFSGLYILALAVAKSFFDRAIPMDDRILSPLYIPALLAGMLIVENAASGAVRRAALIVAAATLAIAIAVVNVAREASSLARAHRSGRDYTGVAWRHSSVADWLRSVNPDTPLYSNIESAVRFLHHGVIQGLPPKADPRSGRPNPAYPRDLQRLGATLQNAHGVVVYFTNAHEMDDFLPTVAELTEQLHLTVVARGDAWIALAS